MRSSYFEKKIIDMKAGRTSAEEDQKLVREAERHDRQVGWYQKVFDRIALLEEEYESRCQEVSLHPDMTDAAIEKIASEEYAGIWE
jgi:2,3-bisphosphoglycerate-independent phosphoglycerate mutase